MLSIIDYTATAGQTNFTIPFPYLERDHIHVYIDDVETSEWAFSGNTTVQLDDACAGGEIVRVQRVTPYDEPIVDFTNGSNLGESDLDAGVLQNLFIVQEWFEADAEELPSGHTLDSHLEGLTSQATTKGTLRIYNEDAKWAAIDAPTTGDILIGDTEVPEGARWFPKGSDGNILQVDDNEDGKLKWVSGFKNLAVAIGDILYASAVGVYSRLAIGTKHQALVAVPGTGVQWMSLFTTGDGKFTLKTTADAGWVMMNDTSIGNAVSGATGRANADTEDLYVLLWTNIPDAWAPVATGRGASAAADFAAGKAMSLPRQLGRAIAAAGTGSGLDARTLGSYMGQEDSELLTHSHVLNDPTHGHAVSYGTDAAGGNPVLAGDTDGFGQNAVLSGNAQPSATGITMNTAGAGVTLADKNFQPTTFWNVMVKL
jgi:hypothetical protein